MDDREEAALMAFWDRVRCHPVRVARSLFPARNAGYVVATRDIAAYAANKAAMLRCASRTQTPGVECYRIIMASIYADLPMWARDVCSDMCDRCRS